MGVEDRPNHVERWRRDPYFRGISSFASFVPFETIQGALFNYWEPSLGIGDITKSHAVAHISHVDSHNPEGALNLVVIHDVRHRNGRDRSDYYFGTFRGIPRGESKGEETEIFDRNVDHIYSRHHRVAGSELNALIRHAVQLDTDYPLSWS